MRGVLLGGAITLVFTAANVYLGLKVGLTFATSIPAAVISMAILRTLRNGTIKENNIVQTIASAAGTLSAVIFVLPGLIMIGWWSGFDYWPSVAVCALGGILGVMYSVPLRRAMVTESDLPYPEGVAAAEILRVGTASDDPKDAAAQENRAGLSAVVWGSVASAGLAIVVATQVISDGFARYVRLGTALTGISFSYSLALLGVGHLVGVAVAAAMLAGIVVAWGIATPLIAVLHPHAGAAAAAAIDVWKNNVRFIGAGTIGVAAIWSLRRLAGPVVGGVVSSLRASRRGANGDAVPLEERDLPFPIVLGISILVLVPLTWFLTDIISAEAPARLVFALVAGAILFIVIAGLIVAAVCGYMAGLIGASNSPVSGLGILTVLGAALLAVAIVHPVRPSATLAVTAYALYITAFVLCVATISNDNLQDLKTGQLVGATPWRQQVALMIGVLFGASVIPPILDLLNRAYGFTPIGTHAVAHASALPAPQATLITLLARGVIDGRLDWSLIGIGALVGVASVIADEVLRRGGRQLPPLAVGLGIYLPLATTLTVVLGAFVGALYDRYVDKRPNAAAARRLGTLLVSGFIVGESLFGVVLAAIIVATGNESPLALVGEWFAVPGEWIGLVAFVLITFVMYRSIAARAERLETPPF